MHYLEVDGKGRSKKSIGKFTLKDTLPLEWSHYNHRNELISQYYWDKNYDKLTGYKLYKKGNLIREMKTEFKDGKKISESYFWKDRLTRTEYLYNDRGEMSEMRWFSKKNKQEVTILFEYKYY